MKHIMMKTVSLLMTLLLTLSVMTAVMSAAELEEAFVQENAALSDETAAFAQADSGAEQDESSEMQAAPTQEAPAAVSTAAPAEYAEIGAEAEQEESPAEVGLDIPVFTSAAATMEGLKLSWNAMAGVSKFRLFKYNDYGDTWYPLADTVDLYYIDSDVSSGKLYQYRLVGLNAIGNVVTGSGLKNVNYNALLRVYGGQVLADGVYVGWTKPAGVDRVGLFRQDGDGWKKIAVSTDTTYLDQNVVFGTEYSYTVRALNADGNPVYEYVDEPGFVIRYLETPSVSVTNAVGGVRVSWKAVTGAEKYLVCYRNAKGGWSNLCKTAETSVLDQNVSSGKTYTYTVRCISADEKVYTSYFDTAGKSVKYIAAPVLRAANGTNNGILVSWNKSEGAAKYRVFCLNDKNVWTALGDTTANSFQHTKAAVGIPYTYTVRCMNASNVFISAYDTVGITGVNLEMPNFTVTNGVNGVDIRWSAVNGAEKYRVYRAGANGWTALTDTTNTVVTDTDVKNGVEYTYTVRCISADSKKYTSGYRSGRKVRYYAAPVITRTVSALDGVQLTWGVVDGVKKYRVFVYTDKGWTKLADTAATTYVHKNVESGKKYTYTVRCLNADATAFVSAFRPGVSHTYIAAPEFYLVHTGKSITVNWKKTEGAAKYRVFRVENGSWKMLADTTSLSYEDKNVVSGKTYTYTVRCINAASTAYTSYFRAGKSLKYVDTPEISGIANVYEGVQIKWKASAGAVKYRVFIKNGATWSKIGDTTATTFTHKNAESGKSYTYTVRCMNAAGNAYESDYNRTGKANLYIAAPKNIKAASQNNTVKVTWNHSAGAVKYRVFYYGPKGWTAFADTTQNFAVHNGVASGTTYRYTVRCLTADSKKFTSGYDATGVTYKFTNVPTMKAAGYTVNGIQLNWNASPGAEKYRVYYYGSRGWTALGDTTSTSFVDTKVTSGTTYRYTVRCLTADGKKYTSDYQAAGLKVFYVSAPRMTSMQSNSKQVTITWNKPTGAVKYRVYKKINGVWTGQANVSTNSYTDTKVLSGHTYNYTVRALDANGALCSGFDPTGFIVSVVTGVDGFYYYDQTQYDYPYGDGTIADSGCGPSSFAMIVSTFKKKSITPIDTVKWCGNNYYLNGAGTYWSYFEAAASHFGITMEQQLGGSEINTVISELKKGKMVISAQSAGRFTKGGHFIVLAGVTSSGMIIVYDPNGANHYVGTAFTPDQITESGTQYWVFSK